MMSQKSKKNQITLKLLSRLLLLTDKRQILNTMHLKDNQSAILNIQLKVLRDHFPKINICLSSHQLTRTENYQFSKIMSHKVIKSMSQETSNSLPLTKSRTFSISKNMRSHMSQFRLLNTPKMWNQPIDMIKNKTMSHFLQDLKSHSFKEDQFLQSKDPYLKVNRTINKLKKIKFHSVRTKLHKRICQDLHWDLTKKLDTNLSTNTRDLLLPNKILNPFSFSKLNLMMEQMFNTSKFTRDSNLKKL